MAKTKKPSAKPEKKQEKGSAVKKATDPKKKSSKKEETPSRTKSRAAGGKEETPKTQSQAAAKREAEKGYGPVKSVPLAPQQAGGKKRLLISYEKLPPEVMDVIRTKYPHGYNHDLKEVRGLDNKKFFVLPIETTEAVYLVKVDLRKPIKVTEIEEEEDIYSTEDEFAGDEDAFPTEELEQIEPEEEEDEK